MPIASRSVRQRGTIYCLTIKKTSFKCYWYIYLFFQHSQQTYTDLSWHFDVLILLHPMCDISQKSNSPRFVYRPFFSYTRVWTSPETGTRACSDRSTKSQRVRTPPPSSSSASSQTAPESIPLCQCQVLKVIQQTDYCWGKIKHDERALRPYVIYAY